MSEPMFTVRLSQIRYEATDVVSFVLTPLGEEILPPVEPGAHIDIHLSDNLMRSYSISNRWDDKCCYRLTVARDARSRGGSIFMHDTLRVGQTLRISAPRNNFALCEDAPLSIFFAGGIGVTPFIPMLSRLNEQKRPWQIYYAVRSPDRAALLGELEALAAAGEGCVLPNYDDIHGGRLLDVDSILKETPDAAHVYCCGPAGMLDVFRRGAEGAGIAAERVHFEYFNSTVVGASDGGFTVVLAKSGDEVFVDPGTTILHAVNAAGANVPFSCEEGVCGACETRVLEGEPDHRDMILSDQEKAENRTMMLCCSGSRSPRLVLDI
jgi:ferredoxin-NADP reductase